MTTPIPPDIIESLNRYVKQGIPTGGFLQAVLSNDLFGAVGRADAKNIKIIPEIASYIFNNFPIKCYGSLEIYDAWLKARKEHIPYDNL